MGRRDRRRAKPDAPDNLTNFPSANCFPSNHIIGVGARSSGHASQLATHEGVEFVAKRMGKLSQKMGGHGGMDFLMLFRISAQ